MQEAKISRTMKIKMYTVPNMITLLNLLCGSMAVVWVLRYGELRVAFALIVAAAVFDFCDGFAARLLGSSSEIGVQLDSLADMVSFGLAPAVTAWSMYGAAPEQGVWGARAGAAVLVIAAFSALRLARFNIDAEQKSEFIGMPTPANAMLWGSLGYLSAGDPSLLPRWAIVLLAVVMSLLLVAPVRMFSLKFHGFGFRANRLRYLFLLAAAATVALMRGAGAVPVIIALYAAVSLLRHLRLLRNRESNHC